MLNKEKVKLIECRYSYIFNTQNPIDEDDLSYQLLAKKFKINKERVISRPPLKAEILNFARKGDINIVYGNNTTPSYLGVFCKNQITCMNEFESLTDLLQKIDVTLIEQSDKIEVVLHGTMFLGVKGNSMTVLENFGLNNTKKISQKFSEKYTVDSFQLSTDNGTKSVHLAPYLTDKRFLYFQLVSHPINREDGDKFIQNHEKFLYDLIPLLGELQ